MLRELALLKKRAVRKGVWFRVLSHVERSICYLTMRAVSTVRSKKLLKTLSSIIEKLKRALESPINFLTRTIGRQLAEPLAQTAYCWGHPSALKWASDEQFIRYLTICYINTPKYYNVRTVDL